MPAGARTRNSQTKVVAAGSDQPLIDTPIDVNDDTIAADEPQAVDPEFAAEGIEDADGFLDTSIENPGFEVVDDIPPIRQKLRSYDTLIDFAFRLGGKKAVRVPGLKGSVHSPTSAALTIRKVYGDMVRDGLVIVVETRKDPDNGVFSAWVKAVPEGTRIGAETPAAD